jgi:hypothetical protein
VDGYGIKSSQTKCPKINVPKYFHCDIPQVVIDDNK